MGRAWTGLVRAANTEATSTVGIEAGGWYFVDMAWSPINFQCSEILCPAATANVLPSVILSSPCTLFCDCFPSKTQKK